MVFTQFKTNIKILRCDLGGDIRIKSLNFFLTINGTLIHYSCPGTPQQNGISKRKNRHISSVVRTLLEDSHVPPSFWVEGTATEVRLSNRLPSPTLGDKSPFEMMFHDKPCYSMLYVFGWLSSFTTV